MSTTVWDVKELARTIVKRLKKDWDVVIAVTGTEGTGKSTLALELGKAINGTSFDLKTHTMFYPTVDEVNQRYDHGPKYSGYVWDEAMRLLYKLNWASRTSKAINQKFSVIRSENKATILCIPRFWDLNEYFRNHRVALWIHCIDRGVAIVRSKDWNPFAPDPWHRDDNFKIVKKYQGFKSLSQFSTDDILKVNKKSIGFEGVIQWDRVGGDIWQEYVDLKASKRYVDDEKEVAMDRQLERLKNTVYNLIKNGFTQAQVSRLSGVPESTVSQWVLKSNKCSPQLLPSISVNTKTNDESDKPKQNWGVLNQTEER